MRGALTHFSSLYDSSRIIPADAGSTGVHRAHAPDGWDHPRGCGEHRSGMTACMTMRGSSPRMRGAPPGWYMVVPPSRIIPADAGSTARSAKACHEAQDHPRGCGEHDNLDSDMEGPEGSSPRMRGARRGGRDSGSRERIIPADAGSTGRQCQSA